MPRGRPKKEQTPVTPKHTQDEHIKRFVALLEEQLGQAESLKGAKDNAKADGYNVSILLKVAKAVVKAKLDELEDETTALSELLEKYTAENS